MAKTTTPKASTNGTMTPKGKRIGVGRGVNEFVLQDGEWYPTITQVYEEPDTDGSGIPKVCLKLQGPGTLQSIPKVAKVRQEFGFRTFPDGETAYTDLTQLCLALQLIDEEGLDPDRIEETMATVDLTAAIGLVVRCQVYRGSIPKQIGTITINQMFDAVIVQTITLA